MDLIKYAESLPKKRRYIKKPKDPRVLSEAQEGKLLVTWFSRRYFCFNGHLIHIPNGAHFHGDITMRAMQMNSLKAQGLTVGCSDYFLAVPQKNYSGLWLELKREKGGKASDNQLNFLKRMKHMGYEAVLAHGFEEAKYFIEEYMG